jgi:GNAT superfamily N-acetyltransferase
MKMERVENYKPIHSQIRKFVYFYRSNQMSFIVRQATKDDIDKLVYFTIAEAIEADRAQISPDVATKSIRTCLEDPNISQYWVIESKKFGVVGSVSVTKQWHMWSARYYWWIQTIFLLPEYRGQNLMELMINHVKDQAKRERALELRMYIHKNNTRALKAYSREGFVESDFLMMAKDLWT